MPVLAWPALVTVELEPESTECRAIRTNCKHSGRGVVGYFEASLPVAQR
jgi:hypothetical protein